MRDWIKSAVCAAILAVTVMHGTTAANATENNADAKEIPSLLIFSKTTGWRHQSIAPGVAALTEMGTRDGFSVEHSEDMDALSAENLDRFDAIVFLNSTTRVSDFTDAHKAALQSFVQGGGGIIGLHAAADANYEWPWYGKMIGGYFMSHPNNPNVRDGTMTVRSTDHTSTKGLPETWVRADEWYDFKEFNTDVTVLITIDEDSYGDAKMGAGTNHPISWYHEYDGARVFYTAMGHTTESYSDENFLKHVSGGIKYVLGRDGE